MYAISARKGKASRGVVHHDKKLQGKTVSYHRNDSAW